MKRKKLKSTSGRKFSETILDFVSPLLDGLDQAPTKKEMEQVLQLATTI